MSELLLLSGGMDSTAIAYWRRPNWSLTIDYGQLAATAEVRAAAAVADAVGIEHSVVRADLRSLGSGQMAGGASAALAPVPEWWPFRNQLLVTLAAMRAIQVGASTILIGCLSTDSTHSDGRADFVAALGHVLDLQEGGLQLEAPAIALTAPELIVASAIPTDILRWSHSCHVANEACGTCRGCRKHYETLEALGSIPY